MIASPVKTVMRAERVGFAVRSRWLLRDVDLAFSPGETVALVGPNGAGKSTLVRLLSGDVAPSSGQVLLDDRPIASFRAHELALRRAVLPQQTLLQFAFTAREVVEMGRGPRQGGDDPRVIAESLAKTESTHVAERIYPSLSGGEQSRVSLSRVLAQEAPILILDEPTASLDLRHQHLVMDVARELARAGTLVIAVLHDLNLAATYADRIVILRDGQVAADGPPRATLTADLLSDVFACPITVVDHPQHDCPLVIPLAGKPAATLG